MRKRKMLLKNFYQVLSIERQENQVHARIFIHKEHAIFKGHFPGNPVMPGVCIMQIIKELTEQVVDKPLFMTQSNNIKFKTIINPEIHSELDIQLTLKEEGEYIMVKNITKFEDTVALQLSATYRKVEV